MDENERRLQKAPGWLRYWFVIHFIADISLALPLFIMPEESLKFLGWSEVNPIMSRIVAAALFGIGTESLIARNATLEAYKGMLTLKIIWSGAAIIGIALSMILLIPDGPLTGWILIPVFMFFNVVWIYWRIRVGRLISGID